MEEYSLKRVVYNVTKGEMARYEHFLNMPQCFQMPSVVDASKCAVGGKGLKNFCMLLKVE